MKKLKVLQLTDAVGVELDYYSEQLEKAIEGKHISRKSDQYQPIRQSHQMKSGCGISHI